MAENDEIAPALRLNLKDITEEAERGNGLPLKELLDRTDSYSERMKILAAVDSINEEHRKDNRFLPDLEISWQTVPPPPWGGSATIVVNLHHNPYGINNTSRIYYEWNNMPNMDRIKSRAWKR